MQKHLQRPTDNRKANNSLVFLGSFLAVLVAVVIMIAVTANFLGNLGASSRETHPATFSTAIVTGNLADSTPLLVQEEAYRNDDLFAQLQNSEFLRNLTLKKIHATPKVFALSKTDRKKFFNEEARMIGMDEIDRDTFAGPDGRVVVETTPATMPSLDEALTAATEDESQNYQTMRYHLDELYAGAPYTAKELLAMDETRGMSSDLRRILIAEVEEKLRNGEIDSEAFLEKSGKTPAGEENREDSRGNLPE